MSSLHVDCVHDAWYKTDRLWLAILVALMVAISTSQAYRAGQRSERKKADAEIAEVFEHTNVLLQERKPGYKAGWDACMEQF